MSYSWPYGSALSELEVSGEQAMLTSGGGNDEEDEGRMGYDGSGLDGAEREGSSGGVITLNTNPYQTLNPKPGLEEREREGSTGSGGVVQGGPGLQTPGFQLLKRKCDVDTPLSTFAFNFCLQIQLAPVHNGEAGIASPHRRTTQIDAVTANALRWFMVRRCRLTLSNLR